jgi:hypothetical protein
MMFFDEIKKAEAENRRLDREQTEMMFGLLSAALAVTILAFWWT